MVVVHCEGSHTVSRRYPTYPPRSFWKLGREAKCGSAGHQMFGLGRRTDGWTDGWMDGAGSPPPSFSSTWREDENHPSQWRTLGGEGCRTALDLACGFVHMCLARCEGAQPPSAPASLSWPLFLPFFKFLIYYLIRLTSGMSWAAFPGNECPWGRGRKDGARRNISWPSLGKGQMGENKPNQIIIIIIIISKLGGVMPTWRNNWGWISWTRNWVYFSKAMPLPSPPLRDSVPAAAAAVVITGASAHIEFLPHQFPTGDFTPWNDAGLTCAFNFPNSHHKVPNIKSNN